MQQELGLHAGRTGNAVKAEPSPGDFSPVKASQTHNKLHKELLLAHKKGLVLSSRSELQQVLERRKRVQSNQDEGELSRTPLEDMLLKRQQKQLQKEKEEDEATRGEAQLLEFFRVRQNLRKIQSNVSNKVANSALES
ncbi:actin-associated protein FAM107A [Oryzias melastigma]|uniref:actin-associated protein FAM107A n=1 Tax=Oryzias melastigma TaxID=30732 RepID=UPI000CF7E5E2|nr:actin-associated protein FAM107A [Oryzias melastigma]XP_024149624.1 actin-associated protein FAM107A [Oryzias melastigma]